jgi:hypothetical protein
MLNALVCWFLWIINLMIIVPFIFCFIPVLILALIIGSIKKINEGRFQKFFIYVYTLIIGTNFDEYLIDKYKKEAA